MSDYQDPFEDPTPPSVVFASADSFRGRLVIMEPTKIEIGIPKMSSNPTGPKGDRITADVTTVDGLGPVEVFRNRNGLGIFLDGPLHRKVWFNQDQIVDGLKTPDGKSLRKMVLVRLDTLKPGQPQGQGNPWVMNPASDADKQTARDFLAGRKVAQAEAPSAPAAEPGNPWAEEAR